LAADFHRETIVDFRMPGNRSFSATQGIDENRMPTAFAFEVTAIALKVSY
jgi:hypothetical protein